MNVSFEMFKKVADTLPISYYLGSDMKLILSETEDQAYFNPMNQTITIGYKILNNYLKKIKDADDLETIIRSLLYHEVSHCILTPPNLKSYCGAYGEVVPPRVPDVINIIEDQRIETLLRSFYYGVDFFENIITLNGWDGRDAETGWEAFYFTTRFRHGKDNLIKQCDDMIFEFNDSVVNYDSDNSRNYHKIGEYQIAMIRLFWNIVRDWYEENRMDEILEEDDKYPTYTVINDKNRVIKKLIEKDMPPDEPENWVSGSPGEPSDGESGETGEESTDMSKPSKDKKPEEGDDKKSEEDKPGSRVANKPKDGTEGSKPRVQKMLETACNKFVDDDLTFKIEEIFLGFLKRTKNSGSAMQRYSGVLNPREVGRDDWRAWTYKSTTGPVKGYDTLHLSLYIDTSGSFRDNEDKVNTILKSLDTLEKKHSFFKFDLVTCQVGEQIRNKDERYIHAYGGNDIDNDIWDIVKKLEDPTSYNIGVVLFDGCAFTDTRGSVREHEKNCGAWNSSRYSIISDSENRNAFETYAPNANKIFMEWRNRAYAETLFDNIQKALSDALI